MTKIETLVKAATAFYAAEIAAANGTPLPALSPAAATNAIAKRYGYPKSRLIPVVAEVYYAENGARFPLPKGAAKGAAAFRAAVRKRRDAGGRLGRWEVVAYSAAATLGRPVSVAAVRAAYEKAGGEISESYTGRGTRRGAPATRENETVEVETTLG